MSGSTVKAVRGDNLTEEFANKKITLRGVQYTIKELDADEYAQCVEAATSQEDGSVRFDSLLKQMTLRCVSPSLAVRKTPMPYPVYRTLEGIVNVMHFLDLPDEAEQPEDDEEPKEAAAPNA